MRGSFVSSEILGRVARRGVATLCRCLPLYSFSQMRSEAVTSLVECAVSTPFCAVKRTRVDPLVHARRFRTSSFASLSFVPRPSNHQISNSPRIFYSRSLTFRFVVEAHLLFQLDRMDPRRGSCYRGNNVRGRCYDRTKMELI